MSQIEIVDDEVTMTPVSIADAADASLAMGLTRAEIDTQISTAKRFPRELKGVQTRLMSYVTLDEETAEECMYALPRGGKPIKGASIRFAEALKASFGNCRVAARVVHVDRQEKVVIAEGVFHDLETNSATKAEVRRRIVDKHGRIFKDDMIIVTGNAACSIALRNAILGGVPKPVWRRAYEQVQQIIAGDVKTLSETREKAIKALAVFGATPDQVFGAIGVAGIEAVTIEHIPTLRGMFAALKNGEATVEEMFVGTVPARSMDHVTVESPLADEAPVKPNSNSSQFPAPPAETDTPASVVPPADAGNDSESSAEVNASDDKGERDGVSDSTAPSLPAGWEIEYAGALRRAQKSESLSKYATMFWNQYGGWVEHKNGPNAETATAIYDAFDKNFGNKVAIESALRELL